MKKKKQLVLLKHVYNVHCIGRSLLCNCQGAKSGRVHSVQFNLCIQVSSL